MGYTKPDKKILEQRAIEDAEQEGSETNPMGMTPEDMLKMEENVEVKIEKNADGNLCIYVMKSDTKK